MKVKIELELDLTKGSDRELYLSIAGQKPSDVPESFEPEKKSEKPKKESAPVKEETPSTAAQDAASGKTLPDVRKALGEKIEDHRAAIKAKLAEFEAKNVSTLDPSHFDEMFEFLQSL